MQEQKAGKKLLAVAFIYPPMARAGVHRSVRFVRYLKELGWDITVLTPEESSYPPQTPVDYGLNDKMPDGIKLLRTRVFQGLYKIFNLKVALSAGKNGTAQNQQIQVRKKDVAEVDPDKLREMAAKAAGKKKPASSKKSTLQRLKDFIYDLFTLPDKEVPWLPYAVYAGWRHYRREKYDVIYSTAPPFTGHLAAYFIKKLTGRPWIADFRDPWARAPMKKKELTGTFRGRAIHFFERLFVHNADRIILNTKWAHREFMEHYSGKIADKFTVIHNGFDPTDFANSVPENGHADEKPKRLTITHTGALYRMRDPGGFFRALGTAIQSGDISKDEIEVRFVGIIARELYESFAGIDQLQDVIKVFPPVPHQEALRFQSESDVLLALQPGTSLSIPGKIFEYIALQKYILAVAIPGATADLVRDHHLGAVYTPEDEEGIRAELVRLVRLWREHGKVKIDANGALEAYNGRNQTKTLHTHLLELTG